jgi:hypothetical protein
MSAELLTSVAAARANHDQTCRYGGRAIEVHLNPADAERLLVEDGEDLCGLVAKHDAKVTAGRLRIYCDLELGGAPPQERASRSTTTPLPTRRSTPVPVEAPLAAQAAPNETGGRPVDTAAAHDQDQ